eukprot:3378059-Pleurochrysis_carterae.AAC.1
MLCRYMHNPSIDCYSRTKELLNYLYSTKGMILVLSGKTISVPYTSTLFATLELRKSTTCSSHNASLTTTAFTSTPTLPGRPTKRTAHTSACLPTAPLIGALAFSTLPPVPAKLRLQPVVLLPSGYLPPQPSQPSTRRHRRQAQRWCHLVALLMDNSTAVEQADHTGASKKTEQYKRWEHDLRECQLDGSIKAHFIRTCEQVADCLTKVLDKT